MLDATMSCSSSSSSSNNNSNRSDLPTMQIHEQQQEQPFISISISALLNEALIPLMKDLESGALKCDADSASNVATISGRPFKQSCIFLQKAWAFLQGDEQTNQALKLVTSKAFLVDDDECVIDLESRVNTAAKIKKPKSSKAGCKKPPRPPPTAESKAALEAMRANRVHKNHRKEKMSIRKKNRAVAAAAAAISDSQASSSSMDLGTIISLLFTVFVGALILFQGLSSLSSSNNVLQQQQQQQYRPSSSFNIRAVEEEWTPLKLSQQQLSP